MKPPQVFIVDVSSPGVSRRDWLCDACADKREASGQHVQKIVPVERPCDDCWRTWSSPTVDAVPTPPGARLPTRAECPMPKAPETWAVRLARLKQSTTAAGRKDAE